MTVHFSKVEMFEYGCNKEQIQCTIQPKVDSTLVLPSKPGACLYVKGCMRMDKARSGVQRVNSCMISDVCSS